MINGLGLGKIQRNFRVRNFHREDPRLRQLGLGSTLGHRPIWAESGHYRNQMSTSGDYLVITQKVPKSKCYHAHGGDTSVKPPFLCCNSTPISIA